MLFPGQARKAAERQIALAGLDASPGQVIYDCISHLVGLGLTVEAAADLAYEVWAARDAARTGCFIDLSRSTEHLVYLIDRIAGVSRPITVRELLQLTGPRAIQAPAKSTG